MRLTGQSVTTAGVAATPSEPTSVPLERVAQSLRLAAPAAHAARRPADERRPLRGMAGALLQVMRAIATTMATQLGVDESEALHAIETVEEALVPGSGIHAREVYFRLAEQLRVSPGRAVEIAQIICRAIAAELDPDHRAELLQGLRRDLRAMFELPTYTAATGARTPRLSGTGHTLADGRPGSAHPLSQSRPPPFRPR